MAKQYFIPQSANFNGDTRPGFELDWDALTITGKLITTHYDKPVGNPDDYNYERTSEDNPYFDVQPGETRARKAFGTRREMEMFWEGFTMGCATIDDNGSMMEYNSDWVTL